MHFWTCPSDFDRLQTISTKHFHVWTSEMISSFPYYLDSLITTQFHSCQNYIGWQVRQYGPHNVAGCYPVMKSRMACRLYHHMVLEFVDKALPLSHTVTLCRRQRFPRWFPRCLLLLGSNNSPNSLACNRHGTGKHDSVPSQRRERELYPGTLTSIGFRECREIF